MQLRGFQRLADREVPGIAARLAATQARVAGQQQRETELQRRHKELQAQAAEMGINLQAQPILAD